MKVLLVCAGGMSTSILMKKMEAYAAEHGIEPFEIAARGAGEVKNVAENGYQIVLLGPQISYLKDRVKVKCGGVPLEVIPMKDYGRQNCPAIFELINRVIG